MKKFKSRLLAFVLVGALLATTVNCGFILYPDRRGKKGGEIDPVVLVMDIAWLIVGVVPGVVALVVDFATGCIYKSGDNLTMDRGGNMTVRLTDPAPKAVTLTVTVSNDDGATTLVSRQVKAGEAIGDLEISLPWELEAGNYSLNLSVNGHTAASWKLTVQEATL
jgi:hypothetical protein